MNKDEEVLEIGTEKEFTDAERKEMIAKLEVMKMKNSLIICAHRYDYGHDWYASIINIRKWSLFQVSISWSDYPSWPYLQIRSGTGDVLSILFWAHKFGLDFTFMSRTWDWARYDNLK